MTPATAAALLAGLNREDLNGVEAQRLFDHWATANPREAAAWALGQADSEARNSFLNVAALRWAVIDLKAAVAWGRSLPEESLRTAMITAVGSEAVRSNPAEALRLAAELPTSIVQADLVCRAAAEWAVTDRDKVLEWVAKIEDENLRQRVTSQIVVALSEQDPAGAATLALKNLSHGAEQDRVIVAIVQRWVQTDPEMAATWVSQFPDDDLGKYSMVNMVHLWASKDLTTSGNWLLVLPTGALRNAGILAYSEILRRADAALADRWALSVSPQP